MKNCKGKDTHFGCSVTNRFYFVLMGWLSSCSQSDDFDMFNVTQKAKKF